MAGRRPIQQAGHLAGGESDGGAGLRSAEKQGHGGGYHALLCLHHLRLLPVPSGLADRWGVRLQEPRPGPRGGTLGSVRRPLHALHVDLRHPQLAPGHRLPSGELAASQQQGAGVVNGLVPAQKRRTQSQPAAVPHRKGDQGPALLIDMYIVINSHSTASAVRCREMPVRLSGMKMPVRI